MSTTVIDRGWIQTERELNKFMKSEVMIGVLDSEVAVYAAANEFGTDRIPSRPFMRLTVSENEPDIIRRMQGLANDVVFGKSTAVQALDKIGIHIQGLIQKTIRSGVGPPNAPSTIEQKGHAETLRGGTRRLSRTKKGKASRNRAGEKKYKYTGGGALMKSISFEIR